VEMEVRELLTKYQFPGDDVPVIRGSALGALNGDRSGGQGRRADGGGGCLCTAAGSRVDKPS